MASPHQAAAAAQAGMVQMIAAYPDLNQAALFQQAAMDPVTSAYVAASAASAYGIQPQLQQF